MEQHETLNRMPWAKDLPSDLSQLLTREWLVTNGLGGYASGTVAGVATRRFHGLLVAAQLAGWFPWGKAFHTLGPQPAAGLLLLAALLIDNLALLPPDPAAPSLTPGATSP